MAGLGGAAPGSAEQLALPLLDGYQSQTDQEQPKLMAPRAQPPPAKFPDCVPEPMSRRVSLEEDSAVTAPAAHSRPSGIPRAPSHQNLSPIDRVRHDSRHGHEQHAADLHTKGGSVPPGIQHCDLVPALGTPRRQLSNLSTLESAQKAASLSRRTSLANILYRMSMNPECSSSKASDLETAASSTNVSKYTDLIQSHSNLQPTLLRIDPVPEPSHAQSESNSFRLCSTQNRGSPEAKTGSQLPVKQAEAADHEAVSGTTQVSTEATDTILLPGALPWDDSHGSLGLTVSQAQTDANFAALNRAESLQGSESVRQLKRTLSDLALEALVAVENLKCPIIEYRQLRFVRKIGEGSIGQVGQRMQAW